MQTRSRKSFSGRSTAVPSTHQFRKRFGRFPNQSRVQIYEQLLEIPLNSRNFVEVCKKPIDEITLPTHLPLKSRSAYLMWRQNVGYLCNFLGCKVMWIPQVCHPWVRLLEGHTNLQMFQVSLSIIRQFYIGSFQNYPSPSQFLCNIIDQIFRLQYPAAFQIVEEMGVKFSYLMWPTYICCFASTTTQHQWETLWDYLITQRADHILIPFTVVWGNILIKGFKGTCKQELQEWMSLQRQISDWQGVLEYCQVLALNYKLQHRLGSGWKLPLNKGLYEQIQLKSIKDVASFLKDYNKVNQQAFKEFTVNKEMNQLQSQIESLQRDLSQELIFMQNQMNQALRNKHNKVIGIVDDRLLKLNTYNQDKLDKLKQMQTEFKKIIDRGTTLTKDLEESLQNDVLFRQRINQKHQNFEDQCKKVDRSELKLVAKMRNQAQKLIDEYQKILQSY